MQPTQISQIGQHYMCAVSELYKDNKLTSSPLCDEYLLYRWWFPHSSIVMDYLRDYIAQNPDDIVMKSVFARLKTKVINNQTYYALYLGKSIHGRTRFKNHIVGPMKSSTLRRTIYALLTKNHPLHANEDCISEILNQCYYEWMELSDDYELLDAFEMMAISLGCYPLNLDGNVAISKDWKELIETQRQAKKEK